MTTATQFRLWWGALVTPAKAVPVIVDRGEGYGFDRFLAGLAVALYAGYGVSMGLFAGWMPGLVSAMKLPMLFGLSLAVCAPPFYVVNCLYGPRLSPASCLRLLLMAASANAVALFSYVPVSYFFVFTTSSSGYVFLVAMHVGVFAVAGLASLVTNLLIVRATGAVAGRPLPVWAIALWGFVYAAVGSHLSWVLRPWVGSPGVPYTLFRPIEGSFIESVIQQIRVLL